MFKKTTLTLAAAALGLGAASAHAAIIGELGVLDSSTGLNAGDQYRLLFVSSGTTTATSTDINTYNTFVQDAADAAGLGAATWSAVGSTETVDARDNTATNPTVSAGVPIYLTDGTTLVAVDYEDLWDGVDSGLVRIDENGDERLANRIFTGTESNGTKNPEQFFGVNGNVQTGDNTSTEKGGGNWMRDFNSAGTNSNPIYGMSDVLTAVPEPSSLALLGLGGLMIARRRRG